MLHRRPPLRKSCLGKAAPILHILSRFGKVERREVGQYTGHLRPVVLDECVEATCPRGNLKKPQLRGWFAAVLNVLGDRDQACALHGILCEVHVGGRMWAPMKRKAYWLRNSPPLFYHLLDSDSIS